MTDDNGKAAREFLNSQLPTWKKGYAKANGIPLTDRKNGHPERIIQNAILQWLTLKGIYHYRLNNQASTIYSAGKMIRLPVAQRGLPDIVLVIGGRYIACEVKAEHGVQSDEQKAVQEATEKAGGMYWLVKSLDTIIEKVEPLLRETQIEKLNDWIDSSK